ncbi:MAG TPA: aldo/keto reductase [Candidatus Anaerostipes excrementavium]|uniref:Aldo/keto reductase n=1 Tax=Candidatus Anaerostipes excrementavium TaxID=2838463 RepID=A0A9D1WU29_9FIRM|nr:aldo/keto reductase [uncultured Anaerostipes sp.]HIX66922.1 aldo/keto reductase [Candidatus Anaerostipes excrementavium]
MKMRKLGEIEVAEMGLGCMDYSHGHGNPPPRQESIRLMRLAHELGCTLFDTADAYADGHNEILVGEALKPIRHEVILTTKYNPELRPVTDPSKGTVEEQIERRLDDSLKRLDTDYIDIYYMHRVTDDVPLEEVAGYMGKFIKKGKIRGWGMSRATAEHIRIGHSVTPVSAIQNEYSLMERDPETDGVLAACKERGIGFVPYMPLGGGFLTGMIKPGMKFTGDDAKRFSDRFSDETIIKNQPLLDVLDKVSKAKGCSYAQAALAWLLYREDFIVPIAGAMKEEFLRSNMAVPEIVFTEDDLKDFDEALSKVTVYGKWDESAVFKLKEVLQEEGYEPGKKSWGYE